MPKLTYNCFNCKREGIIPGNVLVLDHENKQKPELHILCKNCAHTARVVLEDALPGLEWINENSISI